MSVLFRLAQLARPISAEFRTALLRLALGTTEVICSGRVSFISYWTLIWLAQSALVSQGAVDRLAPRPRLG
jgi:hypothetical protein